MADTMAADPVVSVLAGPPSEVCDHEHAETDASAIATAPTSNPSCGKDLRRHWSLVPFIIGGVLITAALGKTHQVWTEGTSKPTLDSWGLLGLIELELALGAALLANIYPSILRTTALILMASFIGVALSKAAAGAPSCQCAGDLVKVSPLAAAIGDAFILLALWRWRPEPGPRFSWLKAASAVTLLALAPWPLLAAFKPAPYPRLIVAPIIDLGQLAPSERRTFALRLRNPHNQSVEVVALESSCPCVESHGVPIRVGPGEEGSLDIVLDLSHEAGFVGPLVVEIKGNTGEQSSAPSRQKVGVAGFVCSRETSDHKEVSHEQEVHRSSVR